MNINLYQHSRNNDNKLRASLPLWAKNKKKCCWNAEANKISIK